MYFSCDLCILYRYDMFDRPHFLEGPSYYLRHTYYIGTDLEREAFTIYIDVHKVLTVF